MITSKHKRYKNMLVRGEKKCYMKPPGENKGIYAN